MGEELSASEALFGFAGWLTSRKTPVTLGASHNAAVAANLVAEFCRANSLQEPRDGWEKILKHPREEGKCQCESAPEASTA